jgi:hypothetical protein
LVETEAVFIENNPVLTISGYKYLISVIADFIFSSVDLKSV